MKLRCAFGFVAAHAPRQHLGGGVVLVLPTVAGSGFGPLPRRPRGLFFERGLRLAIVAERVARRRSSSGSSSPRLFLP